MTVAPIPGRSLVTARAVRELVRSAVLSVYGVSGVAGGGPAGPLLDRLGIPRPGIRVRLDPALVVELRLTVAYGLPVAEVARQVEAAVRYALRQALRREPDRVAITIGTLRHEHGVAPAGEPARAAAPGPAELAASGTDVA